MQNALTICRDAIAASKANVGVFQRIAQQSRADDENLFCVVSPDIGVGCMSVCMHCTDSEEGSKRFRPLDYLPLDLSGVVWMPRSGALDIVNGIADVGSGQILTKHALCLLKIDDLLDAISTLESGFDRVEEEMPHLARAAGWPNRPSDFVTLGVPRGSIVGDLYGEMLALFIMELRVEDGDVWTDYAPEEVQARLEALKAAGRCSSMLSDAYDAVLVDALLKALRNPRLSRVFSLHWRRLKDVPVSIPVASATDRRTCSPRSGPAA